MKETLQVGIVHELVYKVPVSKTVPYLYPESKEFQAMPQVFATGFLVGLIEWACMQAIIPHLDQTEHSVGTHVDLSHEAPTPAGLEVYVRVFLAEIKGRRLSFKAQANDGKDVISRGSHERFVVDRQRFLEQVNAKTKSS